MEENVKNQIQQMLQNKQSWYTTATFNFEFQNSTSVPEEFSCQTEEKYPSHKQKDKERQGIKENTSLSNIYWRYY